MTDIEKLALEAYPVRLGTVGDEDDWDMNEQYRDAWIEGYTKALTIPDVVGQSEQCDHPKDIRHGTGYLECQYCIKCGKQL